MNKRQQLGSIATAAVLWIDTVHEEGSVCPFVAQRWGCTCFHPAPPPYCPPLPPHPSSAPRSPPGASSVITNS